VFEGGGAKGVAYVGALHAIEDRGLGVAAVAGASAGAITAVLVACGYSAARLEKEMASSLSHLAAQLPPRGNRSKLPWLKALFRVLGALRAHGRVLDTQALRAWLAGLLAERVASDLSIDGNAVTFSQLYGATGIELYVVAANVSRQRQVVFSHHTTPACQVIDAVLAACGIPGAFASGKLIVHESGRNSPERLHTIVDGGVWANYPTFVFKDASFRQFHGLGELKNPVIGFLLEETDQSILNPEFGLVRVGVEERDLYRMARFARWKGDPEHPRTEAILEGEQAVTCVHPVALASSAVFMVTLAAGFLLPMFAPLFRRPALLFALFGVSFLAYLVWHTVSPLTAEKELGADDSWPRNRLMRFVRSGLWAFEPGGVLLGFLPFVAILTITIIADKGPGEVFDLQEMLMRSSVSSIVAIMTFVGGFTMIAFAGVVGLVTILKRTLADWGWQLMRTYGAGPGAPPWAGAAGDDWVVRVPIPSELSTLSFDIHNHRIDDLDNPGQQIGFLGTLLRKTRDDCGRQLDLILGTSPK
jgi:NTE family protein